MFWLASFVEKLDKYAELIVKRGANVVPGQHVLLVVPIECLELGRLITKHAYQAGAGYVDVQWEDEEIGLTRLTYASEESITEIPAWIRQKYAALGDANVDLAYIVVYGPNPTLLQNVDPALISKVAKVQAELSTGFRTRMQNIQLRRTLVGGATKAWAHKVFPELDEQAAVEKLWDYIFYTTRIDEEDPLAAWTKHHENLNQKIEQLHQMNLQTLHYRGPGTDLTVDLPAGHIWVGGGSDDVSGVLHFPNMPTEEIFTAPKRDGVSGTVRSTMPLNYAGNIIEGIELTFEQGRVIRVAATKGQTVMEQLIETDDGAHYLGEISFVPVKSPISDLGITFFNTLFDENASCHVAIGSSYGFNVEGGTDMTPEELRAAGLNTSVTHVDFMIGSDQLDIDGKTSDGEWKPIFRNGNWAF